MSQSLRQIPFDLSHRPAFGREDFLVGEANEAAVAMLDRWPDWSAPLLVIQGPPASGKSHLAAVWCQRANAAIVNPESLRAQGANVTAANAEHIVLDGLDLWLGDRAAETELFHLYNLFKEEKRSLLVTMRMAPAQVEFAIPDLASRFRAAPLVAIEPPDDDLLSAILIKLFHDRQLTIGEDVIRYILPRMERSFAAAHDIVSMADRRALAQKRSVSIAVVRDVLAEMQNQ